MLLTKEVMTTAAKKMLSKPFIFLGCGSGLAVMISGKSKSVVSLRN
jgi:hypothetical protein